MTALTFPISSAVFWAALPISELRFDAPEQVEISQTAQGEVMSADVGPMLWTGEVTLGKMTHAETAQVQVMLDLLRPAGRAFYAFDSRRRYPASSPNGAALSGFSPTLVAAPVGSRELQLDNLPSNFVLTRGDYLCFDYGGGRRALHQVVPETVQADSVGLTPLFEVTPMPRSGVVLGATVRLTNATCKCRIVPGSVDKGRSFRTMTTGMSFRFQQTLG